MARQKGIIKLEGTIGDITFVKTKDGYLAKEKTGINGSRISTDAAFKRTRENAAEFGRAGKAGKVLRQAFRSIVQKSSDSRVTSRLTKEMIKLIKADATGNRGERMVLDAETEMLKGFEFNVQASLSATVVIQFTTAIDRAAGTLVVTFPAFSPQKEIEAPDGATHFKLVSGGAAINFETGVFTTATSSSAILPWTEPAVAGFALTNTITPNSTNPLFLLLGIQFYQMVNNIEYELNNGSFNALAIVMVNGQ